jgi:MtN3 and saliva related transmembrane protein
VSEYALYIGIAAGVCTSISMLPQLVKIIKTKKADDISYGMVVVLLVGVAAWIWYGVLRSDYPIIVTNSFSLLVNMLVLVFSLRYKKNRG